MPKINLKPNSPEFDSGREHCRTQQCEMPGCPEEGDFRAPKDRSLSDHYWFCQEHVREYNKAWNFFEGMADTEVQEHMLKSLYGDRPTWQYGVNGKDADELYRKAWQTYNFTEEEPPKAEEFERKSQYTSVQTPEYEALAIMGLEPPVTLPVIKKKYKELAKKYHPDLNQNDRKAEELLKQINMAYTILKVAFEKFEKIQTR